MNSEKKILTVFFTYVQIILTRAAEHLNFKIVHCTKITLTIYKNKNSIEQYYSTFKF